jgi:hypothetical protein
VAYVKWELPHQGKQQGLLEVFEYSNSREYTATPDVFEYEKRTTKPVYDLILGFNTMKEFGIVLDYL